MPKNKLIYYGILIVAAVALIWLGFYIFMQARALIYGLAGIGIIMIIVGMVMESNKAKSAKEEKPEDPNV